MQINMFDVLYEKYLIQKPIRLIELFGGYGSQHFALKYLGVDVEHWKLVEWAVKSIQAYKDAHCEDDTDYSMDMTKEELVDYLFNKGISSNYNEPMTLQQIKRKNEQWLRNVYNNIIATDYGIPQTRNRTFMVSILGEYSYTFPKPIPLKLKLKDMLENEVDEQYYLSNKQIEDVKNWNAYQKPLEAMEQIDKKI